MIDITIDNHGVALAASQFGADSAPPVLFLHGIGNARDTWSGWAAQLADRHRVITLDFRGHGHSARASRYHLGDYVSDAEAALEWIGEPTLVVGHSLGGTVAGRLAQLGHPIARAVLMVDPAWMFGIPEEFARTVYPRRFELLQGTIARLTNERATHAAWVEAIGQSLHPWGGVFADHTPPQLIAAHASALRRQDPACFATPVTESFGGFDPLEPFACAATLLHADERCGAAILADQAARVVSANPTSTFRFLNGSDHFPHRSYRFAARFEAELREFLST